MDRQIKQTIDRRTDFNDNRVCVAACNSYDTSAVAEIIDGFFEKLDLGKYIKQGCKVVIKPNLVIRRSPDEATTTHPEVVGAVIRAVKRLGAGSVTIAESSGGIYNKAAMSAVYSGCGIAAICEREGAQLHQDYGYTNIECPDALQCHQFNIINPIIDADVIIDIAKLKTHAMTGFSGCVKNMFGSVPGLGKPEMHCQYPDMSEFQQMIVDLCILTAPTISIMDAIDCMEGDGPTGGSKRFVGALLAGANPFAVDIAACNLIAVKPESIHMLRHGMERGISPKSLDNIEIIGDNISSLRVDDFVQPKTRIRDVSESFPPFVQPIVNFVAPIIAPRPIINTAKCVGCGKCAESCPQHTIDIDSKKHRAIIKYSDCIRCYCCHEMCPVRAIDIKRRLIVRL